MIDLVRRIWAGIAEIARGRNRRLIVIRHVEDAPRKPKANVLYMIGYPAPWRAALLCPCGCESVIHLSLLRNDSPRWRLAISENGLPTLHPSVRRISGCRSHFFLVKGEVIWCDDE
jgi:hypothetical protein